MIPLADDVARRATSELLQGRTHAAADFNLTTGATSTVVTRTGVSHNSVILTQAYSALASNADITRIVPAKDSFTVTHTNSANVRTHRYVFLTGLAT